MRVLRAYISSRQIWKFSFCSSDCMQLGIPTFLDICVCAKTLSASIWLMYERSFVECARLYEPTDECPACFICSDKTNLWWILIDTWKKMQLSILSIDVSSICKTRSCLYYVRLVLKCRFISEWFLNGLIFFI